MDWSDRVRRAMNSHRARFGPPGPLTALRFTGQSAEGDNQYATLKTYRADEAVNAWTAKTARGEDGALFTVIRILDGDGEAATLVDAEGGLTDFALVGRVFKVESDQTERPLRAPYVWTFRAHVNTTDVYAP